MTRWETVIGLEVHCQLATESKLFSACPVGFGEPPNTLIDAYTLGFPGTLPVPNARAVRYAIALGLAVGAQLQPTSRFARKHYFYPDLPKGYQISQGDEPYAVGGGLALPSGRRVPLVRIHIEEDAGKNVHDAVPGMSLVDLNRAGAPLLEIVSEPAIRSAPEAAEYLRELRSLVRALGISTADMEKGTLRCDANVSIRPEGTAELGTRCEIKNLNSFRFLERAIEAEVRRQIDLHDRGEAVVMATMSFDANAGVTRVMRTKEEAADYRYLPEPDLPPLVLPAAWIEAARRDQPELPWERRTRYREAGLSDADAEQLVREPELAALHDETVKAGAPAKATANWITGELVARLDGADPSEARVDAAQLAELIAMVEDATVSGRSAKAIFATLWEEGGSPRAIAERDGHQQVSDTALLEAAVDEVLAASPKQVDQYRAGKTNIRGYFVGQVMKKTKGQANPKLVNEIVTARLDES